MESRLTKVDLNLLVALRVLIEERSVTNAAKRLFITQPAMSKTLGRLRELFGDELFVRGNQGLILTPKAEALKEPLWNVLRDLETTIFDQDFNPRDAKGLLRVAMPELVAITAVPMMVNYFAEVAPDIQVHSGSLPDNYKELLAEGTLDFAVCISLDDGGDVGSDWVKTPLLKEGLCLWHREDHPLMKKEVIELQDLIDYPSVTLYVPTIMHQEGDSMAIDIGVEIEQLGIHSAIYSSQLLIAMELLIHNDWVMLGPRTLSDSHFAREHLVQRSIENIPGFSDVQFDVWLIQHRRTASSALHTWIREEFARLTKTYLER